MPKISLKKCKQVAPEAQTYGKNRNFDSFGAVFPHSCPDKREICNVLNLCGEKPIFVPRSEIITGLAALCTNLLVMKQDRRMWHT